MPRHTAKVPVSQILVGMVGLIILLAGLALYFPGATNVGVSSSSSALTSTTVTFLTTIKTTISGTPTTITTYTTSVRAISTSTSTVTSGSLTFLTTSSTVSVSTTPISTSVTNSILAGPLTIGTAAGSQTALTATHTPMMRKVYYALGSYWAFYWDGSNFDCVSSLNGIDWSSPRVFFPVSIYWPGQANIIVGGSLDTILDRASNTFVWAQAMPGRSGQNNYFYYQIGTLSSGGCAAITWSIPITKQPSLGGTDSPSLTFDSDGNLWVSFKSVQSTMHVTVYKCTKPFNSGCSWVLSKDIAYSDSPGQGRDWNPLIRSFTNGRLVLITGYGRLVQPLRFYSFDGSAWDTGATTQNSYFFFDGNSVTVGDTLYGAYASGQPSAPITGSVILPGNLVLISCTFPCSTLSETTLNGSGQVQGSSISTDGISLLAMYVVFDNDTVKEVRSTNLGRSWNIITIANEAGITLWSWDSDFFVTNGTVPWIWTTASPSGSGSYNVRFETILVS